MLTVQYTGATERTIGVRVAYPGETLQATPIMLASWQAEHGDVFVVAGAASPDAPTAGAVIVDGDGGAHVFGGVAEADAAGAGKAARGRRK